jgi:PAS domain S-box-containing protein
MSWPYAYTPYIWPMLASAAFMFALALYALRHRTVPAAVPFALGTLSWAVWAFASALELAATDDGHKLFWFTVQAIIQLPSAALALVFVLAYAGLERWLTRRNLVLLFLPCFIVAILVVTNDAHHMFWQSISIAQMVTVERGPAGWVTQLYAVLLFPLQIGALIWLFIRSPLHRWPAGLILAAQLLSRATYLLDVLRLNPFGPLDAFMLAGTLTVWAYFIALFRFRMLRVVPIGRYTAVERMTDGMVLLDAENRVVDANPAARQVLALSRRDSIGRPAQHAFAAFPDLLELLARQAPVEGMLALDDTGHSKYLQAHISPLVHPRGFALGWLVLLRDVTHQKKAQAQLLEQQRALATLQEREHLARELHDNLSQELAFLNVQAQAAHELLLGGASQQADDYVLQLASVARQAQVDARDMMSGLMSFISPEEGFVPTLRRFLEQFCRTYGIETELSLDDERAFPALAPTVQVQLLRIVQEALTNIRKHAQARHAPLWLRANADRVELVIEDDGVGFGPAKMGDEGQHFGLRIMRERAATIGGALEFDSEPGKGTRVVVRVPIAE